MKIIVLGLVTLFLFCSSDQDTISGHLGMTNTTVIHDITAIHDISGPNTAREASEPARPDQTSAANLQIIVHNDDDTPQEFVVELLHSVFKTPVAEAMRLTRSINHRGQASCGIYPSGIANRLLGAGVARDQLVATSRQFRGHMRADVQIAIDRLFAQT
jgi:ATP-dependent Clp protease adapter protein ClpS